MLIGKTGMNDKEFNILKLFQAEHLIQILGCYLDKLTKFTLPNKVCDTRLLNYIIGFFFFFFIFTLFEFLLILIFILFIFVFIWGFNAKSNLKLLFLLGLFRLITHDYFVVAVFTSRSAVSWSFWFVHVPYAWSWLQRVWPWVSGSLLLRSLWFFYFILIFLMLIKIRQLFLLHYLKVILHIIIFLITMSKNLR